MELIKCSCCGAYLSNKDEFCPYCGAEAPVQKSEDILRETESLDSRELVQEETVDDMEQPVNEVKPDSETSSSVEVVEDLSLEINLPIKEETCQIVDVKCTTGTEASERPQSEPVQVSVVSSQNDSNENRGKIILGAVALLLFVVVIGVIVFTNVILPNRRDAVAPRYYTIANQLNIRSSIEFAGDYNKLESVAYGSQILVYDSIPGKWLYGKFAPRDNKGNVVKDRCVEGYMYYGYVLPEADFFLLNSIFGDAESRKMLSETRYKHALLDYYKSRGIIGDISNAEIVEHGINSRFCDAGKWQVFCKDSKATSNNVYRSRKLKKDSKYTDVAIIIKNIETGARRLLFFVFDDDETPRLLCEQEAPEYGYMKDRTLKLIQIGSEYGVKVEYTD